METKTTKQILCDAKELIQKGWTQRAYRKLDVDGNTCYCSVGAISQAVVNNSTPYDLLPPFNKELYHDAVVALATEIDGQGIPKKYQSVDLVVKWNDHSKTNKQDVIDMFDKAIAKESVVPVCSPRA